MSLEIARGEYVAIAGPSGCGKSTLLSILGLLDSATQRLVLAERPAGRRAARPSERARVRNREIGFIFQSFNLIGDLTVFENVELPLTYRGMRPAERRQRVTDALERVGMAHRAKHLPSQLSGGQQQRVAVARAVAGEPVILLADEPTGNLDSKSGEAVMELLRELHQTGATICMVTHDPRYARHADAAFTCSTAASSTSRWRRLRRRTDRGTRRPERCDADFASQPREVVSAGAGAELRAAADHARHQGRRVRVDHGAVRRGQVDAAPHPGHARRRAGPASTTSSTSRSTRLSQKQRAELHKRHIGFVFQSYHLLDNLTVYENLEMPLSYRNVGRKDRQTMVADVLDRFQIVGKKDLYPSQLSGGQQQLVGVARAVIANPEVMLADEPTGNLHSEQGKEIMELFRKLNEAGTTIVQVTHSDVNASYGSRIIHLRDGWIVDD